jgi:hypothetical protein
MSKRPSETDRRPSVTESGDDDTFLSRWARRKRVARSGADPDARESDESLDGEMPVAPAPDAGETPTPGEESQPLELTDEDMPPVNSIDENTDMSGFFSPKVSRAVKKAALKKFFHSPAFNIVDGLDDYDDDFTTFAALGDIVTSDMRSQMELEADESMDGRVRAKQDARADESMDGRVRAKQDARAGRAKEGLAEGERAGEPAPSTPPGEETLARSDAAEASPASIEEDAAPAEARDKAADAPGITRDPAGQAKAGPAKLRRRGGADNES